MTWSLDLPSFPIINLERLIFTEILAVAVKICYFRVLVESVLPKSV